MIGKARLKRIEENNLKRLSLIPRNNFGRILDLGCGEGVLSQKIKKITRGEVYGIDISLEKCRLAGKKGIKVKQGDLNKKIPFKDKFFDLVFAGEIIEHMYNPDIFLKEIRRVLKDDGILILTTPNLAAWHNRLLLFLGIQPYNLEASTENAQIGFGFLKKIKNPEPAGHVRVFTLGAIKDLLKFHGFETEKIKGCPGNYFPTPVRLFEKFISLFPSLSSTLIIRAGKKRI